MSQNFHINYKVCCCFCVLIFIFIDYLLVVELSPFKSHNYKLWCIIVLLAIISIRPIFLYIHIVFQGNILLAWLPLVKAVHDLFSIFIEFCWSLTYITKDKYIIICKKWKLNLVCFYLEDPFKFYKQVIL